MSDSSSDLSEKTNGTTMNTDSDREMQMYREEEEEKKEQVHEPEHSGSFGIASTQLDVTNTNTRTNMNTELKVENGKKGTFAVDESVLTTTPIPVKKDKNTNGDVSLQVDHISSQFLSDADSIPYRTLFSWSEEDLNMLLQLIEPVHLTTVARKAMKSGIVGGPITFSFRNLYYYDRKECVVRLQGINGYVKPGEMLGVIGSPDAGITSLFDFLCGRLPVDKNHKTSGELFINGAPIYSSSHSKIGYVRKEAKNLALLTVRETLYFSAKLRLNANVPEKILRFRVEMAMKQLGISHVADNIVGDNSVRGISGGERRRVMFGCELVAGHACIISDQPTDGLDTGSAYNLIKNYKFQVAAGRCMITSVSQPSEALFNLFDKLLVLSKGAQVYFGPREKCVPYLASLGFHAPNGSSVAQFLEKLSAQPELFYNPPPPERPISPIFKDPVVPHLRLKKLKSKNTFKLNPPQSQEIEMLQVKTSTSSQLESSEQSERIIAWRSLIGNWSESELYKNLVVTLYTDLTGIPDFIPNSKFDQPEDNIKNNHFGSFPSSYWQQVQLCTIRQFTITWRNRGLWVYNFLKMAIISIIVGSLFFAVGNEQTLTAARIKLALFYFLNTYFGNAAIQMISVLLATRFIVSNETKSFYYHGSAYYISLLLVFIPIAFFETLSLTVIFYPMCDFRGGLFSEYYVYFFLVLFMCNLNGRSWMLLLSSLLPNQTVANILAPVFNCIYSAFCGYLNPRSAIPRPWIWAYYVNWYTYALRGLALNELKDGSIEGQQELDLYDMGTYSESSKWEDLPLVVVFYFAFNFLAILLFSLKTYKTIGDSELPAFKPTKRDSVSNEKMMQLSATPLVKQISFHDEVLQYQTEKAEPILSWNNLSYSVNVGKERESKLLLNNTFGYVGIGKLTALMGNSGAGKSTLMDVLFQKKTGGHLSGEIVWKGRPLDANFKRIAGYVEQFDTLEPYATVRESLVFSGRLRLPKEKFPEQAIQAKVDSLINLLGLSEFENQLIGTEEGGNELPPDVRKKVSIGIELIAEPQLLALDEPTTGLDHQSSVAIMTLLKELSRHIPIICTIHQPSNSIVELFDQLLLLKPGGEITFFGPMTEVIAYFEQFHYSYPASQVKRFDRDADENISDYALGSLSAIVRTSSSTGVNISEYYKSSTIAETVIPYIQELHASSASAETSNINSDNPIPFQARQYACSYPSELYYLTQRFFLSAIRRRNNWYARMFTALFFAFVTGTLFYQLPLSSTGALARLSLIYFSLRWALFSGNLKFPEIFQYRTIYFREHSANFYRSSTAYFGYVLADFPFIVAENFIYVTGIYWIAGFTADDGGRFYILYLIVFILCRSASLALIDVIAMCSPNVEIAQSYQATAGMSFMLLSGYFIPYDSIPNYWRWGYFLSYYSYSFNYLSVLQLSPLDSLTCPADHLVPYDRNTYTACPLPSNLTVKCDFQCGDEVLASYSVKTGESDLLFNFFMLFVFVIVFRVASAFALRYINFVKR